jgi:hypothetical protein
MSTALFRTSLFAAALLSACSRSATPSAANLTGSYVYSGNGTTFSKPWRFSAILDLRADRTYRFTLDKTIDGKRDPTESSEGTFSVDGDHLLLAEGSGTMDKNIRKLRIRPDSLVGELGWTAQVFLKGVGAPNLAFVRIHRS